MPERPKTAPVRHTTRPARAWVQATGSATGVVGKSMALTLGGQTLRWTISAREGRTPLPGRGPAELRWSEGPEDLLVLVDRPPVGRSGAPLYEHRQLHRLGGGGLALTIEKPDAAPLVLNTVLYWIGGAPDEVTTLRVEIDGGQPRRREGAQVQGVTPGSRVLQVLPTRRVEVVLPDRRGMASAGVARVATILGDDLAPGRHTIKISPVSGPAAWARFFRAGVADVRGGALQWNERRGAVTLEDSDKIRRLGFVIGMARQLVSGQYAPDYAIFAKGDEGQKLIITGMHDGSLDTIYRARALFANMTLIARSTPFFQKNTQPEEATFFDLLKLLGFTQVTISDGKKFCHQVIID